MITDLEKVIQEIKDMEIKITAEDNPLMPYDLKKTIEIIKERIINHITERENNA